MVMRTVCLINSYNYAKYIEACVLSAVRQTHPFDAIFIVDDGSTDNSRLVIEKIRAAHDRIHTLFKENGGQLSCFNACTQFIQPDDLVCLLDADDVFPEDYLELLLQRSSNTPAEFYFCEPTFFKDGELPPPSAERGSVIKDFNWQISTHAARTRRNWTGSPTSCISMKGSLFLKLLPLPLEGDWRTRADDVLIYGSAIAGASKCYLPTLTVGYRVHGSNGFYGRTLSEADELRHQMRVERLFNTYCTRFSLEQTATLLDIPAQREIKLVPEYLRDRFHLPANRTIALQNYRGVRRTLKKLRMMLRGQY